MSEALESYLVEQAKALLLDQDQHREERPDPYREAVVMRKITRFDQGEREGQITATLNALLVLRDPSYTPAPGFDDKRNDLRADLLTEARRAA